jgi:hypothetical protein
MSIYEYASIAALLWAIVGIIIVMKPWHLD